MIFILIISLIILFGFEFACAWIDDEHYDKKQWVEDKTSRATQRGVFLAGLSLWPYFIGEWWLTLIVFLMYGCIFGATFDPILNIVRGFKIFYVGVNSETDKKIREFPWLNTWGRLALFLVGIFLLVKYFT